MKMPKLGYHILSLSFENQNKCIKWAEQVAFPNLPHSILLMRNLRLREYKCLKFTPLTSRRPREPDWGQEGGQDLPAKLMKYFAFKTAGSPFPLFFQEP